MRGLVLSQQCAKVIHSKNDHQFNLLQSKDTLLQPCWRGKLRLRDVEIFYEVLNFWFFLFKQKELNIPVKNEWMLNRTTI